MKKLFLTTLSLLVLGGCSLIAPYSITFTTPALTAVDPLTDTLDLVLSQPAMAYLSEVDCEGYQTISLLPVVNEAMETSNVHNLTLELLDGYAPTTRCEVTVTAFDQSTTSTTASMIALYVLELPADGPDYSDNISACEAAGGTWNECGSSCEEGDPFCVQVCVPQCEFPEVAISDEVIPAEEPSDQEACIANAGLWHVSCDDGGLCEEWCAYEE